MKFNLVMDFFHFLGHLFWKASPIYEIAKELLS